SDAFAIGAYAGLRAGAIVVPINPRSAPPEIDYFITDAEAALLVFGPEVAAGAQAWRDLPERASDVPALALGPVDGCVDVLAAARTRPHTPIDLGLAEDDDALIIYTSGTTGRPKGALFDHHRVLWVGHNTTIAMGLRDGERILHVAPLYHSATLNMLLLNGMMLGATHVILPSFAPETVLETIEKEHITAFFGVPTMYAFMLRGPGMFRYNLSSLRNCLYGAAPMPASTAQALVDALPHARILQACGQTEGGPGGIMLQHEEVLAKPAASGRSALPNTEARIVDLDGRDIEPGEIGEMIVRGETMMKGYWRNPQATAETIRDGWVHTGDLARIDEDGYITLVDRMKDMIITGGANVYSAEVENALAAHPAIADIAVIGLPDDVYGESVLAIVTPREGATLTLDELREFGRERLSAYKLPRQLHIGVIPRNASGKILKRELRNSFRN
ncbi:MAG: AMP-binding protein, partial [Actinomycetia bacterium]|nr:AMP-binding protein [Actinomycetes bacterium]